VHQFGATQMMDDSITDIKQQFASKLKTDRKRLDQEWGGFVVKRLNLKLQTVAFDAGLCY